MIPNRRPFAGLKIEISANLLRGFHVLKRRGEVVWYGPLGSPIEDAEFDTVVMHPDDADRLVSKIMGRRA